MRDQQPAAKALIEMMKPVTGGGLTPRAIVKKMTYDPCARK
jgi:hypothetical protein